MVSIHGEGLHPAKFNKVFTSNRLKALVASSVLCDILVDKNLFDNHLNLDKLKDIVAQFEHALKFLEV